MDHNIIDENLNLIAKKSRNILYSTRVFEKTGENIDESIEDNIDENANENIKRPKIILKELKKEENGKENRYWAIILKYKVSKDITQEVIMGTVRLSRNSDLKDNTVEIKNLIVKQLEENFNNELGYKNFEKMCEYVSSNNIPFKLTMEGQDILASKSQEIKKIPRTCFENNQGKIENLFSEEDLEKMKKERKNELEVYMNKIREKKKWNDRREKILKSLKREKKDQDFLRAEKLTDFLLEADNDPDIQRKLVGDYFLGVFEDKENVSEEENPVLNLANGYVKLKEKGLAIDANIILEKSENKCYTEIKEKKGDVSLDISRVLELIEGYESFFNLVKQGRDWNARLNALKLNNIDFDSMKALIQSINPNDEELLQYIDLKGKMVNELQLDSIDVEYNKDSSVGEMYDFLLHSSVRKNTRQDDETVINKIYMHTRKGIIQRNLDKIELYNHYAEKSNRPMIDTASFKEQPNRKMANFVTYPVKKICLKLDEKINQEIEEEKDNKESGNEESGNEER